jgi:Putative peptidoglycan binding domain
VSAAGRATAIAASLGMAACGGTRRAAEEDAPAASQPKAEAPDRPSDRGVPAEGGRPEVPAAPEALLAEGAVGKIQEALVDRGLLGAHRRGELDEPTSRALQKFQEQEGLAMTGFPDRETLSRLGVNPDEAYGRGQ